MGRSHLAVAFGAVFSLSSQDVLLAPVRPFSGLIRIHLPNHLKYRDTGDTWTQYGTQNKATLQTPQTEGRR